MPDVIADWGCIGIENASAELCERRHYVLSGLRLMVVPANHVRDRSRPLRMAL